MSTRIRQRLTAGGDETGTALVLAMLVVLLVGALLAAVLDFTRTGLTVAPSVRDDRNESNFIQGAVEGAANKIRYSSLLGSASAPGCPDFEAAPPSDVPGAQDKTYRVTCSVQAVLDPSAEAVPPWAIHALGAGVTQTSASGGGDELVIDGGIYSKGYINVPTPPDKNVMTVYGAVIAEGGCTGSVYTTDLLGTRCSAADALPLGDDPGYGTTLNQSTLAALMATGSDATGSDPLPTCSGSVVHFLPAHYSVPPPVLAAYAGCTSPSQSTWHFASGLYYFDYAGTWDIGLKKVVFGDSADLTRPLGTACTKTSGGAHLVFGGDSRIRSSSSSGDWGVEVCGPSDTLYYTGPTPAQRIAVYGLTQANDVVTPTSTATTGAPPTGTPVFSGSGTWTSTAPLTTSPQEAARSIDGTSATTTLAKKVNTTVSWSGFPTGPKGSDVTKVELLVSHTAVNTATRLRVDAAGLAGQPDDYALASTCPSPCAIDITDTVASHPGDVLWRYLSTLAVDYVAEAANNDLPHTVILDGIALRVTHVPAAPRAQTCTASCLFFESGNNPNVHLHGTVYTAESGWRVRVHGSGETIFDRGIVLSQLEVVAGGSSKQTSAPFQLPHGPTVARQALFRGFVDPDGTGGQPAVEKVRACVTYTDVFTPPGATDSLAFPGHSLSMDSWLAYRSAPTTTPSCA